MSSNVNTTASSDVYDGRYFNTILKEGLKYEKDTFAETMFGKFAIKEKSMRDTSISSNKYMFRLAEDEVAPLEDIKQGFTSEIPYNIYGLSKQYTKDVQLLNNGDRIKEEATSHAESLLRTRDAWAGSVFALAFDPTSTIADGSPLISKNHSLRVGGTQKNTFDDVQRPLTFDNLKEARNILERNVDHSGNPLASSGKLTLLVPNEQDVVEQAFQLVGGDAKDMKPSDSYTTKKNYFTRYEGNMYNLVVTDAFRLNQARAIGLTTDEYDTPNALNWINRWFLVDEQRAKSYLAMVYPEGGENFTKQLETESMSQKHLQYARFGFGVRGGVSNFLFGSMGNPSILSNF
jgi:hypothetical protein